MRHSPCRVHQILCRSIQKFLVSICWERNSQCNVANTVFPFCESNRLSRSNGSPWCVSSASSIRSTQKPCSMTGKHLRCWSVMKQAFLYRCVDTFLTCDFPWIGLSGQLWKINETRAHSRFIICKISHGWYTLHVTEECVLHWCLSVKLWEVDLSEY